MAAREPPTPMKQRQIKSPRINKVEKSCGLMYLSLADRKCRCSVEMLRYSDDERKVGPRVRPMMYL